MSSNDSNDSNSSNSSNHVILFDGACGLCRRAVDWVGRRDRARRFDALPYQDAPAPPMTPALRAACARAVHVITRDGRVLSAGRASLFVLGELGYSRTAMVLGSPPLLWIVEAAYRLVARNRGFFGQFLFTR
jgi:predicted DCC family thiol-disulfide oxidoreductase YuxK